MNIAIKFILRSQKILIYLLTKFIVLFYKNKPSNTKPILKEMLQLNSTIDYSVNQLVNIYYQGRHPKHYLWTSHNDFIVHNIKPGEKVLDIGCGASQYTKRLAEKGVKVTGIDRDSKLIEKIKSNNKHPNLTYKTLNILKEIPKEKFDTVICSHIIEHLDDPIVLLKKLHKITNKLIIKVPRIESSWLKLVKRDIGMFWLDDPNHKKEYDWDILQAELKMSGWQPILKETGFDLRVLAKTK